MMKTAYGDAYLARSNVFEWFGRFWEGCKSVEDKTRAGCLRISQTVNNIERVCASLKTDQRMPIKMSADDLNIDKETVLQIVEDTLTAE